MAIGGLSLRKTAKTQMQAGSLGHMSAEGGSDGLRFVPVGNILLVDRVSLVDPVLRWPNGRRKLRQL